MKDIFAARQGLVSRVLAYGFGLGERSCGVQAPHPWPASACGGSTWSQTHSTQRLTPSVVWMVQYIMHPLTFALTSLGSRTLPRDMFMPSLHADQRCDRADHLRRHGEQREASDHPAGAGQASTATCQPITHGLNTSILMTDCIHVSPQGWPS